MNDLIYLAILFLLSAFFSASETAYFAVSLPELNGIKDKWPTQFKRISYLREKPKRLIITVLIGGEFANITITAIITGLLSRMLNSGGEVVSLLVSTTAIMMFGDLIPKSIAFVHSSRYVRVASLPLSWFMKIISPVRAIIEGVASAFLFLFGIRHPEELPSFSESKFRTLVDEGEKSGEVDRTESALIHNIFELTDQKASNVMTPVNDVFMIEHFLKFPDVVPLIKMYRHSRIPVFKGDRNNIVGILYFKDSLKYLKGIEEDVDWHSLLKEPYFVPETKRLLDLLDDMRKRKIHMSVIIDEFGDVTGIVTLEDILEELFGEIQDEYDAEESQVLHLDDGEKIVSGKMEIEEFNELFDTSVSDEEFDTLGGMILHLFGYLPKKGEKVESDRLEFTVERLQGIRVLDVRVKRTGEEGEGHGS